MINAYEIAASSPWAIRPEWLTTILDIAKGNGDIDEAMEKRLQAVLATPGERMEGSNRVSIRDGVAIVSIRGPIFRYANLFTAISGATSIQTTAQDFQATLDNPEVHSIILEMDTPGGMVTGVNEFSEQVFSARGAKPIIAYVGGMAASAGYWIASAADEIVTDATGELGSIGVVMAYLDTRERDKKKGIEEIDIVSSVSPDKRPDPKTERGMSVLRQRVDALADVFVGTVARNRGIESETVLENYGQGAVFAGSNAIEAGLADRLGSLESLIAELAGNASNTMTEGFFMSESNKGSPAAEQPVITVAFVKASHPDVAQALIDEGAASVDQNKIETEATEAERKRISAINGLSCEGFEEQIQAGIDGGDQPEAVAMAILQAQKERGTDLSSQAEDATAAGHVVAGADKVDGWDKSFSKTEGKGG